MNGLGTIDLQHVSAAAAISADYFPGAGQISGLGVEMVQAVNGYMNPFSAFSEDGPGFRESAWDPNDFLSNAIWDYIGSTGQMPKGLY